MPFSPSITVPFRYGERIGFTYLVSQKYTGDSAVIKVLRKSKTLEFNITLGTHKRLIPAHLNGKRPSYYIVAGFVFTAVTVPYLRSEVSLSLHKMPSLSGVLSWICLFLAAGCYVIICVCM